MLSNVACHTATGSLTNPMCYQCKRAAREYERKHGEPQAATVERRTAPAESAATASEELIWPIELGGEG